MKKRSGKPARVRARTRASSARTSAVAHGSGFSVSSNAVFLVGFMGAGKTSVGRALGKHLNWSFEDLDERIERRERRTVAQIFHDAGEQEFRRAEHEALLEVLDELRAGGSRVTALGGGAFVQDANAKLLRAARVPTIFLDAPLDELWRRCCKQGAENGVERPLQRSQEQFRKLYAARRKAYEKASSRVQTGDRQVDEIAAEIATKFGLRKVALRTEQGEVE